MPKITAASTSKCGCPCNTLGDVTVRNMTSEETKEAIKQLKEELKVLKSKLSSTKRKLTSAKDDRVSAQSIGVLGAIFLIAVVLAIVISDAALLMPHLSQFIARFY